MNELTDEILSRLRQQQPQTIAAAIARSRDAKQHSGEPDPAWSMGEKLLNALVLGREDQLAALDYTRQDAIERVRWDFGVTEAEFPAVLEQIRGGI